MVAWVVVSVLALLGSAEEVTRAKQSRIVGGHDATPGEYPSLVSLQSNGFHFCGGTLISPLFVLTAGHCVMTALPTVVIGAFNLASTTETHQSIPAAEWIRHPQYSDLANPVNDIALLRLSFPTTIVTQFSRPIFMLPTDVQVALMTAGALTVAAGWGHTTESGSLATVLQEVILPIVAQPLCLAVYGSSYVENAMICAGLVEGGIDTCQGDSGGPIFSTLFPDVQVGITSFGDGCARPNAFGVYTKLSSYASFVTQYVQPGSASPSPSLASPSTSPSASPTPLSIECGQTVSGSTVGKPNTFGSPAGDQSFRFRLTRASTVAFNGCDSSYDTVFHIISLATGRLLATCDDCGGCGLRSNLIIDLTQGEYLFVVDGFQLLEGAFRVTVTCNNPSMVPTTTSSRSTSRTTTPTRSRTLGASTTGSPTAVPTNSRTTSPTRTPTKSATRSRSATKSPSKSPSSSPSRTAGFV